MIPDSPQNRVVTRGFITIVSAMPLLSFATTLFASLFPDSGELKATRVVQCVLFSWFVGESLFWGWAKLQSQQTPQAWEQVTPSVEERGKLKEDWICLLDNAASIEFVEGWFQNGNRKAQFREIHVENLKDWLCWAFFSGTTKEVEADSTLLAEMQDTLRELCNKLDELFPDWKIPEGRNAKLQSVRLTLDPIRCEHRPLLFYIVVYLLQAAASILFRLHSYSYFKVSRHPTEPALGYWYRAPGTPASSRGPIVVVHGVGSVLPLIRLVTRLADRAQYRHIFILDLGHVSMRLPRPSRFPSPEGTCSQICSMLDRHVSSDPNFPKASLFTHSLGSAYAVWMLKVAPERLGGLVLCDPISILLQHPAVAYNFLYRESLTATEMFFEWIARERGIALTLGRHFHWFQNIFPMISDTEGVRTGTRFFPRGLRAAIFLSERDCIVPSASIVQVMGQGKSDNVDVYVMPELDHGGFVFHDHWLERVVQSLLDIDTDG